jgi:site-specific DNA recombinase
MSAPFAPLTALPSAPPTPDEPLPLDIYLRLSDLRLEDLDETGTGKTFRARGEKLSQLVVSLGYRVGLIIVENDEVDKIRRLKNGRIVQRRVRGVSAFKRKRVLHPDGRVEYRVLRPGFRKILDRIDRGLSHGLVAEDLDRVLRDLYDTEDLLAVVRRRGANVRSLSGTLRLTNGGTADEEFMVRQLALIAHKFSQDVSRRVKAGRQRKAEAREWGGGARPFGFEPDGITPRPREQAKIAEWAGRILAAQASLGALAQEMRDAVEHLPEGVFGPPRHLFPNERGGQWAACTLRDILLRPRNAGIFEHNGEEMGPAPWEPILPEETWRLLVALLTNPARRTAQGRTPKYLGAGVFRCGVCGGAMKTCGAGKRADGSRRPNQYQCRESAHLGRQRPEIDVYVVSVALAVLSRPDALELLSPVRAEVDVAGLRREVAALEEDLLEYARMRSTRTIGTPEYLAMRDGVTQRLAELRAELESAAVEGPSPAATLASAADLVTAWQALPLATQQAVVRELMVVTLLPSRRRGVNRETVAITPAQPALAGAVAGVVAAMEDVRLLGRDRRTEANRVRQMRHRDRLRALRDAAGVA